MLRDFEIFSPVLYPVVLRLADNGAPALPVALTESFDPQSAQALNAALSGIEPDGFSGRARDNLALAERELARSVAAFVAPAEPAPLSWAVLTAPWRDFRAGTLALVHTTPSATIACLTKGARIDPATGAAVLYRNVVSAKAAKPSLHPMEAGAADPLDSLKAFAGMAGPYLSGAAKIADALFKIFGGPSDTEILVAEIQKAVATIQASITAAVAELEGFITNEKLKDITARISGCYHWLREAAAQTKAANTEDLQVAYARRALGEMAPFVKDLRENLDRLTMVSIPGSLHNDMYARNSALKLLFHGTDALFTMDRLQMQFHAFLALHGAAQDRAEHKANAQFALTSFKLDVLGDDRDLTITNGDLTEGSFLLAYSRFLDDLTRDVAANIKFLAVGFFTKIEDPYFGDGAYDYLSWPPLLRRLGASESMLNDWKMAPQKMAEFYIQAKLSKFYQDGAFTARWDALNSYWTNLPGWNGKMTEWKKLMPAGTPGTQAAR